jgi:peptide/nickel transport system ATP-binding protein
VTPHGGPVLTVAGLEVVYHLESGLVRAVDDLSFELQRGEILGVVGESGCGKSTLSAALLRLLSANGEITAGRIELSGRDLMAMNDAELRRLRGRDIAMIFQDPLTSLNPTFTVGAQLVAAQKAHTETADGGRAVLRRRAIEVLTQVGMPDASERIDYYPHQFSGGMRQRIMIAMALLLKPDLLIADEATSALDVTLQAQILQLLRDLRQERGTSMVFISHDLGVINEICDRVIVMYAGRAVEEGEVSDVLHAPKHPYTQALLASVPTKERRGETLATIPGRVPSLAALPPGCTFADRCGYVQAVCREPGPTMIDLADRRVRCSIHDPGSAYDLTAAGVEPTAEPPVVPTPAPSTAASERSQPLGNDVLVRLEGVEVHYQDQVTITSRLLRRIPGAVRAVDGIDLEIRRGEVLGLVGESGSGKTTLGKALLGLVPVTGGRIIFEDRDLTTMDRGQLRGLRRRAQMIFQDSHASLSPRLRVEQLLTEPYRINRIPEEERTPVAELLDMVQLSGEQAAKYPHELSGGQARRIGIARALSLRPEFIVADEPSAGLDVSAAASVLNLMKELAAELGLTYLIITHDLNLVGYIADRIALMYLGRLVETGTTDRIFDTPTHPYTQGLLEAVATPDPQLRETSHRLLLPGEIPSPKTPPSGCRFHTRCRYAREASFVDPPVLEGVEVDHQVACHHWREIRRDPDEALRQASPLPDRPGDAATATPVVRN